MDLPGFNSYVCNRDEGQHGGIQVSLRKASGIVGSTSRVLVHTDPRNGIIWVKAQQHKVLFAVCYFAPHDSTLYASGVLDPNPLYHLFTGIGQARSEGYRCVILGDLNIRIGTLSSDVPVILPGNTLPSPLLAAATAQEGLYVGIPPARNSWDHTVHSDWAHQLLDSLHAHGMVILNGRASGDEAGEFTYHQPLGRGRGQPGASVVDLACVCAEWYSHVQSFKVLPLDLSRSPDHRTIQLFLSVPVQQQPARPSGRVAVHRPTGKAMADAYRVRISQADPKFDRLLQNMQAGSISLSDAIQRISDILKECCVAVDPGRATARASGAQAPWFDDECRAYCTQFRTAWSAYLALRSQFEGQVPANHPVLLAAKEARQAYARIKRRKKRMHAKQQQRDHIEAYFSEHQRNFWQAFNATRNPPCPISDVREWTEHYKSLYGAQPPALQLDAEQAQVKTLLHQQYSRPPSDMECLNVDLTYEEVEEVMNTLPRFKAADAAGLTCELLRAVVRDDYHDEEAEGPDLALPGTVSKGLVECLTYILNQLPMCAAYPLQVATGKLAPIPKKGNVPLDKSTYRGICVSSVFSKLHDTILNARAEPCIEDHGLRAPTQFGFRRQRGTLDALFVTNHLICRCMHTRAHLYMLYVDCVQAFDRARRTDGMLARAQQLGIHGPFLQALSKSMENIYMAVCVNGELGEPFATHRGTKQGSELSPLLFGMFIEQLHELIEMQLPGAGPVIDGLHVPDIIYADDVKLMAVNDPAALQQLLDVLHLFCCLFDMEVNLKPHKTCIIIYRSPRAKVPAGLRWYYDGKEVHVSDQYVDLGILHRATQGIKPACDALAATGSKAMHALLSKCRQHYLVQPDFKLRMFDVLVEPVLSYGCQIWGPEIFCSKLQKPQNLQDPVNPQRPFMDLPKTLNLAAEKVHLSYLRIMSGVGRAVDKTLLLREFGRYPIMWHWIALAVRFWVRAVKMADTELVHKTLKADIGLMLSGCQKCWSYYLLSTLSRLGIVDAQVWSATASQAPSVDNVLQLDIQESAVRDALKEQFDKFWSHPRINLRKEHPRCVSCPEDAIMHNTYAAWVRGSEDPIPTYLKSRELSFRMVQCIAKLRLGWHGLAVQTGRFSQIPRAQRGCKMCVALKYKNDETGETPVEDVLHFLLECRALDPIRDTFPVFFKPQSLPDSSKDTHMKFILNHSDHVLLVRCISVMKRHRETCLELISEGRIREILPERYIPEDRNLWRLIAAGTDALGDESDLYF